MNTLISKLFVVVKLVIKVLACQYLIRPQKQLFNLIVRQTHVGFLMISKFCWEETETFISNSFIGKDFKECLVANFNTSLLFL